MVFLYQVPYNVYYMPDLRTIKKKLVKPIKNYWHKNIFHKIEISFVILAIVIVGFIYGIGQWYIYTQRNQPYTLGVSFIPDYASSLGLNPQQTMTALLKIGVKNFRLTSYWSDLEPTQNNYNFSSLDWQFKLAQQYHAKILLVVGLRQPRWPECHPPSWILKQPTSVWENELYSLMTKLINRYKNSPSLSAYQLENEYFLKGFGDCTNFSRSRLIYENNLIKKLDPNHPIIVGRSNNALGFPIGQPQPDEFSISIYKRVWDANVTHRYLEYPYPNWFYSFLAGIQEIFLHKNMIIGEMQAEAWPPNYKTIPQTSLSEQNKSLNATRLKNRFSFAKSTGMHTIYFWGAEYWYYRKEILHDPSLWNVAKEEF